MTKPFSPDADPHDLNRFLTAQADVYDRVVAELKRGEKRSHWMWFIFPQVAGLGFSSTSRFYAIKSRQEALQYLIHPILGPRLIECCEPVLATEGKTVDEILGYPDDMKLRSSMTLFEAVAGTPSVFAKVLDKYFSGDRDTRTLELMAKF